jgi:hypothetical protein
MSSHLIDENNGDLADNAFGSDLRYRGNSRNSNKINFEYIDDDNELESKSEMMIITVPTDKIDQLQRESENRQVSLNTRINQIIRDHLDLHLRTSPARMSYVPKSLIIQAINQLTEQKLSESAQHMVNDLRDMSILLRGEFSISSFLDTLRIWLKMERTPNRFEQDDCHNFKIVIRHDMGYKYSYLLKEMFRYIMEQKFHRPFDCTMTETTILIKSERFIEIVHQ